MRSVAESRIMRIKQIRTNKKIATNFILRYNIEHCCMFHVCVCVCVCSTTCAFLYARDRQIDAQSSVQLCVSYVQCSHINTRVFHSLGNVIRVGRGRFVFQIHFSQYRSFTCFGHLFGCYDNGLLFLIFFSFHRSLFFYAFFLPPDDFFHINFTNIDSIMCI